MARRWQMMSDERLLDLRLCDLDLHIEGSAVEERTQRIDAELADKGLRFRPHYWVGAEWFTPDGVPGVAVPFYLVHPRLTQLERDIMLDVEGLAAPECLRILRHEAGHAIDNAYRLHRRKRWREIFGSFTDPYPETYSPRPNSRRFVQHLTGWYAQAHPAEDFAETFAVWLTPGYPWRRRYADWPALEKLEYVDELMREIADEVMSVRSRRFVEPLKEIKTTLRQHYASKREIYAVEWPAYYDRDLRRIFLENPPNRRRMSAAAFLRTWRFDMCRTVSETSGVAVYTVNHLLKTMIERCRALNLRLRDSPRRTRENMLLMLMMHTMHVARAGYPQIAL
ncbi:MAG: putative zinc-binding metallopeptidase [Cephaloticoccus sp.]|nr:putative zinc-binding metallopeptidase [Cephaloticoccus sp.]MCF7760508.1 putative zinc-binding metallopeptidase [Cephaloticoccus sp.]